MMLKKAFVLLSFAMLFVGSCTDQNPKGVQGMQDQAFLEDLRLVAAARIYLGHQSVGDNIVEGLNDIKSEIKGSPLNVIPLGDSIAGVHGFFVHSHIGNNGSPDTKCQAFRNNITQLASDSLDVAMMKFCFADFGEQTEVPATFATYKATVDTLHREFPGVMFIHVTAPLIQRTPWWKRTAKAILGRPDDTEIKNRKVNEFNSLLTDYYRNQPMFDLARIESTAPDGTRYIVNDAGKKLYSILSEYTSDGAHLNARGREIVAKELIHTLAKELRSQTK